MFSCVLFSICAAVLTVPFSCETWNLSEVLDLDVANKRLCFISGMKSILNTAKSLYCNHYAHKTPAEFKGILNSSF